MKKRVLSIILCFMMLCSLLPTAALAVEGVPDVKYINVTGGTEQAPTFGFGDPGENTMAVYISGSGDYKVEDNFSGIATIINDTAVTIEGGAVNTEDVYIFGEGSLTVGDVTFTSGHEIELSDDTVDAIFGAVMTEGSDVVDISGTITAGTELVVYNAIISGALEFAAVSEEGESGHLTISGGGSLTVEEGAAVTAAQDAKITALAGATISGITLYAANTTDALSENGSYTVTTEDVDGNYAENFIWLENDDNSEPLQKWVQMVDEGDPNAPKNNEYWFEYDWRDDATVKIEGESIPSRWSESYTDPINFTANEAISFTLTPPSDDGTYNSPVVEVEVFDWTEEKTYNTVEPLTATDGTYAYTPTSDSGFVVRVWWTTEEYDYDTFGPGEGEIAVEVMINGSESATVTSDTLNGVAEGKKRSVGTKTKYILDESVKSIDLLITPGENEQINDIIVGWEPQEFAPDENGSVSYTWILSDENSHYFEAVFGGTGGEGEDGDITYSVDFGSGSWTIGEVTVTADRNGTLTLTENDSIILTNFDANTMEVKLTAEDGFNTTLTVTNGETSLAAKNCDGLPNAMTFAVVAKDSGGGEDLSWYTVSYGNSANVTTENGSVTVERIRCGENIFTNITSEVDEAKNIYPMSRLVGGNSDTTSPEYTAENDTLLNYKLAYSDGDIFIAKDTEGVSIDYKFIPDYGYQVTNVYTNEDEENNSLLAGFTPGDEISSFTFNVIVNSNFHFYVKFTETEDSTNVTSAANVDGAAIENGQNAADRGNLALTVSDTETADIENAVGTFDITLQNVVSKGGNNGDWTTNITEFADPITISLILDTESFTAEDYTVYREHNGKMEELEATYNPETGELTFKTNKFSAYTIVERKSSEPQTYTVTIDGSYAAESGAGSYEAGAEVTVYAGSRSNYRFARWTKQGVSVSSEAVYTFEMPAENVTLTANWYYVVPYVPPVAPPVDTPTNDEIDIPISGDDETIHVGATVSGDTVTVDEIDIGQLDGVIGSDVDTGTVTIGFSGLDSAVPITTIELPANVVKEIAEAVNDPENDAESLEIVMPSGVSITFDADALSEKVSQADGADITISIESHEDADLTDAQKDAVGSRPAFDINVTSGGEHISDIGGKITIGASYELKPNEKENGLVVWYVDNEGNRERCQGNYDPINKRMNWETNHLSLYMIDYCPSATFADLDIDAWYTDSTDFVIANGLMNGIGDDKFDPDGTTTRAMIVTILWRLEGSPVVNYAMDFEDVDAEQWYTEAVRWAASEKIVEGYGNGKFGTNDAITREQMVTIMFRYAKYKGYDVSVGENTNILSYGDAFDVAEWAIPAMQWACGSGMIQGIADGSTMNLVPQGNATRAQAAAILQRYVENVAKGD